MLVLSFVIRISLDLQLVINLQGSTLLDSNLSIFFMIDYLDFFFISNLKAIYLVVLSSVCFRIDIIIIFLNF